MYVRSWRLGLAIVLALAAFPIAPAVSAQDESPPKTEAGEARQRDDPVAAEDPLQREKERRALAGMAAIAGIAIVGVALIALIVLWAGRLRRWNREPLPSTNVKNEFWFLRPPKPPVSDHGPGKSEEQH